MSPNVDRRGFLLRAGAGAAGLGALAAAGCGNSGKASQDPDRRNVVLVIIDSVRPDHVGCYAGRHAQAKTPNIDALAKDSLRFTSVFPEAMPTIPARRAIMSGHRSFPFRNWEPDPDMPNSPGWQAIPASQKTWLQALGESGYRTGYVTTNPWVQVPSWKGFRDAVKANGFFDAFRGHEGQKVRPASSCPPELLDRWLLPGVKGSPWEGKLRQFLANEQDVSRERDYLCAKVFRKARQRLAELNDNHRSNGQPFALVVDSFDPHEPWYPMVKYVREYTYVTRNMVLPGIAKYGPANYLKKSDLRHMRAVYSGMLTMVDHHFGSFMDRFHDLGLDSNTLLIFLSDHGVLLGDRGYTGKLPNQLHPELIHVPYMIRDPDGRRAGRKTRYHASTQDVGPTILSYLDVPTPKSMDGTDLGSLLTRRHKWPKEKRPTAFGGYSNTTFNRDRHYALIADNHREHRQFFDLRKDRREVHNIARHRRKKFNRYYNQILRGTHSKKLPYYSKKQREK